MFALVINICLNQAGKSSPNSVSEIGDHNAYICEISHILQSYVFKICVSFHLLECKLGRLVGDNMVSFNAKMGISVRRCLTEFKMSLKQGILERGSGECDKELIKNRWRWDWLFAPCKFLSPLSHPCFIIKCTIHKYASRANMHTVRNCVVIKIPFEANIKKPDK